MKIPFPSILLQGRILAGGIGPGRGPGRGLDLARRSAGPGSRGRRRCRQSPRSGYRDRIIAAVVVGLLIIAWGATSLWPAGFSGRCRSSRWGSAW